MELDTLARTVVALVLAQRRWRWSSARQASRQPGGGKGEGGGQTAGVAAPPGAWAMVVSGCSEARRRHAQRSGQRPANRRPVRPGSGKQLRGKANNRAQS